MSRILVDRLDHIRRNFLWDGRSGWRKMHLIEWSIEVKPKFMVDGNWALLAKWQWMLGGRKQGFVEKGNCFQECGVSVVWFLGMSLAIGYRVKEVSLLVWGMCPM